MEYPRNFINNIQNTYGYEGEAWLQNLPRLIETQANRWSFDVIGTINDLSFNYVVRVFMRKMHQIAILKLSFPFSGSQREILALQYLQGKGVPEVYQYDVSTGAILMEAIDPGTNLYETFPKNENQAMQAWCELANTLHSKPFTIENQDFPKIADWLQSLFKHQGSINKSYLLHAQQLSQRLLDTASLHTKPNVLLHGDLHHHNTLLSKDRGWVAIDPKGVVGEELYEAGAFIRNPMPGLLLRTDLEAILHHRIEFLSEKLNCDPKRLQHWSFVQSVLAACWACEDNDPHWKQWKDLADHIYSIHC